MAKFFVASVFLAFGCADAASLRLSRSKRAPPPSLPDFDEQCDDLCDTAPVDAMILAVNTTAGTIGDKAHETMMGAIAAVSDMKAGLVNESLEEVETVQDKLMALALAGDDASTSVLGKMDKGFSALGPKFSAAADGVRTSMQTTADKINALSEASFIQEADGGHRFWPFGGSSPSKETLAQAALSKVNLTLQEFPSKVLDKMNETLIEALDGMLQAAQQGLDKFEEGCNVAAESISDGELGTTASKIMKACSSASDVASSLAGMVGSAAKDVSSQIASIQAKLDALLKTEATMQKALDAIVAAQELEDSKSTS